MRNRWSDADAQAIIDTFPDVPEHVALRVYASRLIGSEPTLVMHGGGNTSVKATHPTIFGDEMPALYVKGSGWNLDTLEPPGLPALDLEYLRRLRSLDALSDEDMVNQLRTHLFDASSPNPSVETLLHAFLPHTFVDHSHADAILCLSNQPDGEHHIREALGADVATLHYVMPGFDLSKAAAEAVDDHPDCIGLVLHKHGLFSFGETAKESYDRHIELVTRAEDYIQQKTGGKRAVIPVSSPTVEEAETRAAEVAPLLRRLWHENDPKSGYWVVDFRFDEVIRDTVSSHHLANLTQSGPLTPDHIIRTKEKPLILESYAHHRDEQWLNSATKILTEFMDEYDRYFERNVTAKQLNVTKLDPLPRVVLVKGLGLFCVGRTTKEASIAADLYEHTINVKTKAPLVGRYEGLDADTLFDMEYWSLEQAKLGRAKPKPLEGKVALVTGAGGAIGSAVCRHLGREGACVVAADVDKARLEQVRERCATDFGAAAITSVTCNVTDSESIDEAVAKACKTYGGIDILVLNAGIAHSAKILETSDEDWQNVIGVNLTGYFKVLKAVTNVMIRQQSGGNVIINASKNVFAPGKEFSAYSASKAAGTQLGKVAAMELASHNIRVNMINADAVFDDGKVTSHLWETIGPERAKAKGIPFEELQEHYRKRNLLHTVVSADDVARAILFFAQEHTPTTGATLPVDGGIPEAFPR